MKKLNKYYQQCWYSYSTDPLPSSLEDFSLNLLFILKAIFCLQNKEKLMIVKQSFISYKKLVTIERFIKQLDGFLPVLKHLIKDKRYLKKKTKYLTQLALDKLVEDNRSWVDLRKRLIERESFLKQKFVLKETLARSYVDGISVSKISKITRSLRANPHIYAN